MNSSLRSHWITAPERASKRLLIVLHGLGDSSDGYRGLPDALDLPWLNYLLVDAPDPYYGGFSWYDFAGEPAPGIERSRRSLFELLDARRQEGWPTEQTTMFGFSQGCLMTWEVGLRYPHRLAGLIGISGYVHDPERALAELSPVAQQQHFLITHGTADSIVPFALATAQVQQLAAAGLDIAWHEYRKAHTMVEEEFGVIRKFVERCHQAI